MTDMFFTAVLVVFWLLLAALIFALFMCFRGRRVPMMPILDKEKLICEHKGCTKIRDLVECTLLDEDDNKQWFCYEHARENGHCPLCGSFCCGLDTFERNGYCDLCYDQIQSELDDFEKEQEEW